ncbi:MAG TPA: alpha/beta hydrolase-fold protein [Vicinamibacterales bacterium]|nr:alpha/beta hydrolase-fold protein [Vicinamibacterales bacterium]
MGASGWSVIAAAALGASLVAPSASAGRLDIVELHSTALGATRTIRVWTPPNLPRGVRCDVLYLNDGQNLFGDGPYEDGGGWHADAAAAALIAERTIDPLIVVGIDNGGDDRARGIDYLPFPDPFEKDPAPSGADRYLAFVIDEVIPYVNAHYPTRSGAVHTGFGGSSYGAASAFYAALSHPGVFGRLLLESPSVGAGNGMMLERARTVATWPERIDIGVGTLEGRGGRGSGAVQTLTEILKAAGLTDARLRIVVQEGGGHNEAAWASRFPDALAFLFKK